MFDGLAGEIEKLIIPVDGAALAEAFTLADRLQARLAEAVTAFDHHDLWELSGATSMTAWLADRAGMTRRAATHTAARARRLARLPVTAEAWSAGDLSVGQVDAIVAAVDDDMVELFAAHEAELVPSLSPLSTRNTARAMAVWKAHAAAGGRVPDHADRAVHLSRALGGTAVLDGTLSPEGFAIVKTAMRIAENPDAHGDPPRTPAERRHDALVDVCRWFLDHQYARRGGRHRPHLNVIVNLDDLDAGRGGQVVDGPALDRTTVSRLLCDSALHRVLMAGRSSILDYGTTTRTTPVNLWNALVVRDEGCRWPGCDRPPEWCEAHHVRWVTRGGPTRPDNQALLCSRHHHIAHLGGWQLKLSADGALAVTDPGGRIRTTRPPGALCPMVA